MRVHRIVPAVLAPAAAGIGAAGAAPQTSKEAANKGPEGTWEGTLKPAPGTELRLVLTVTRPKSGPLKAEFASIDQPGGAIAVDPVALQDGKMTFGIKAIMGRSSAAG